MIEMAVPARCILHADLDAFYASVEQVDHPEFRGKPVLVGGSPERRGVVAACSYEARAYGIRSAMPMRTALNLHPQAVVISPRFERYRQFSDRVMGIFHSITLLTQPMSLDEAYMDVTDLVASGVPPVEVARSLKERVKGEVGLVISVGVATSKSVAKIASDIGKPDGLVVVEPGTEQEFLASLPVKRLLGIGPRTDERLASEGITTLGDLAMQTESWVQGLLGKRGPQLLAMSRGEDSRPVATEQVAKSVSAETTFASDVQDSDEIGEHLERLCQHVASRLQNAGLKGKTVTVKLRLSNFRTFTRAKTLTSPVSDASVIQDVAWGLADRELLPGRRFRLLGVGISSFTQSEQLSLFEYVAS